MNENLELNKIISDAYDDALKKRGIANILIAGKTGVGKSTLINTVFQGRLASTGQGKPITQSTKKITKEGVPISIYDTKGLEVKDYNLHSAPDLGINLSVAFTQYLQNDLLVSC
ncbi:MULTISPECIES: GTPase [unclassified Aeromonas]|uniref:GTPase n=1 Tax=unclassified Aeromonas TaxID=257493 RepID=UPI0022E41D21|nr:MULTISPECIES: GTPase [unclassified Aeromonas]